MSDPILDAEARKKAAAIADRLSLRLKHIAHRIRKDLKSLLRPGEPEPVFALFVMTEMGAQYVGNGAREDIYRVVATVLSRWEDQNTHVPMHEKGDEQKEVERNTEL